MDKKQKAIEELKKQQRLAKERLGPEGMKELEKLAKGVQGAGSTAPQAGTGPYGTVPYDKKAALAAFQLFLKNHGNPADFERRLRDMIMKSSH